MAEALLIMKKIVSALVLPMGLGLVLLMLGLSWRRRSGGLALLLAALLLLGGLSLPVVGMALLSPLESAAGDYADPAELARTGVNTVVILGGGISPSERPLAEQLSRASLARLHEGVRLFRGLPGARLVISEGKLLGGLGCAEIMARLAQGMGVGRAAITLDESSLDTEDQARNLAPMLRGRKFVLVTSAFHVPRTRRLFQREGLDPIMAPADFRAKGERPNYFWFLPSATGLALSELALKEYLGRLWVGLKELAGGGAEQPAAAR